MTVALENVTRTVGAVPHISDVSLTFEQATLSVLLGPTQSGKTSLMRLLAGLDPPTTGRIVVNGIDVTGVAVRSVPWRWSISSSSTTPHCRSSRILPLLCVSRSSRRRRSTARGGSRGKALAPGTYVGSHAITIVRRPAAADRDCTGAGERRRSRAARRAAGQSRLQAARRAARRAAAHLRGRPAPSSSTPPPSRPRHCCWAAAPSACRRAVPCRPAGTSSLYRRPDRPARGRAVLRSAAQHRGHREKRRRGGLRRRRHGAGQRALCRRWTTGRTHVGFRAHQLILANGAARPPCLPGDGGADGNHRLRKLRPR